MIFRIFISLPNGTSSTTRPTLSAIVQPLFLGLGFALSLVGRHLAAPAKCVECARGTAADKHDDALTRIIMLHNDNANLVNDRLGRSASNGQRLLELLEGNPIVNIGFVCEQLSISRTTAARLMHDFERLGILQRRDAGKQRYRVYLYESYLTILRQGSDPL